MNSFRLVFTLAMWLIVSSCVSAATAQSTSLRQGLPLDALVQASGLALGEVRVPVDVREAVRVSLQRQGQAAALVDVRVLSSAHDASEVLRAMAPTLASQGVEQAGTLLRAGAPGSAVLAAFSVQNIVVVVHAIEGQGVDAEALAHAMERVAIEAPRGAPHLSALPSLTLQPGETRTVQTPPGLVAFTVTAEGDGYARRVQDGFLVERREGALTVTLHGVDAWLRFVP
jgi:hypothetical protein